MCKDLSNFKYAHLSIGRTSCLKKLYLDRRMLSNALSKTEYINSRGIHLAIRLVEIASEAGITLYAYGLNAHQRRIFSMVGLLDRLTLVEDEQDIP